MDTEYNDIDVSLEDDGRARIRLNRPESLNALSNRMADEILAALDRLEEEDVRVLVLRGAEGNFCAGADVGSPPAETKPHEQTRRFRRLRRMFNRIESFPRPTVAAIEGYCLGGGCEIACCCDTRIATESATIGVPEIMLGVIPAGGGTQRLSRLIGLSRARDMVLRGKHHDAETMQEYGFVHELADDDAFEAELETVVEEYLLRPPVAMEVAKMAINGGFEAALESGLEMEALATGVVFGTEDAQEGLEAFREDRDPEFEGE
ncbi:enoyl-CoA hydratase/isomerase family protein [Natronorubrum tibetense]|uniref:3-hydroxyacyl-CoA dehydrogenase NAD-binding protein n=1 Tax=Natronorubrum tibetense GA33 TaxID=1114856 RepID=L9VL41_9EURY|nr:enoyl-CoA hydratase/isomerase family protein [Natronorubrum tibetense]ELY37786.1 3-hydroxyacyl-CoA dehydrogenase NAD-binding protein [Natronorubrum tibetense GA33]